MMTLRVITMISKKYLTSVVCMPFTFSQIGQEGFVRVLQPGTSVPLGFVALKQEAVSLDKMPFFEGHFLSMHSKIELVFGDLGCMGKEMEEGR
jgi:hypothetical protein